MCEPAWRSNPWYHLYTGAAHAMRDEREWGIGFIGNAERLSQGLSAPLNAGAVAGEDRRQRFALLDPVAGASRDHEANAWVDAIVHLRAAPTERDDSPADRSWFDARNKPAARSAEQLAFGGLRQNCGIVDNPGVSSLRFNDSLKVLGRLPRTDRLLHLPP